jgi:hypothetical protein
MAPRTSTSRSARSKKGRRPRLSKRRKARQGRKAPRTAARAAKKRGPTPMEGVSRGVKKSVQALSGFLSSLSSPIGDLRGEITTPRLLELLGEHLAVEQGIVQFHTLAWERAEETEDRRVLELHLNQTRRHVDLLENAIRDLGGNPAQPDGGALFQQERAEVILGVQARVPHELERPVDLEAVLLAVSQGHHDWECLRECIPFVADPFARDILRRIVDEVEDEKDEHLRWTHRATTRAVIQRLLEPVRRREVA